MGEHHPLPESQEKIGAAPHPLWRPSIGRRFWLLLSAPLALTFAEAAPPAAPALKEKPLFAFAAPDDLKAWSNLDLPGAREKEPPVKLQLSGEQATSGRRGLK